MRNLFEYFVEFFLWIKALTNNQQSLTLSAHDPYIITIVMKNENNKQIMIVNSSVIGNTIKHVTKINPSLTLQSMGRKKCAKETINWDGFFVLITKIHVN